MDPITTDPTPTHLTATLERAITAAKWLTDADAAAVQLARRLALELEQLDPDADVRDLVSLSKALADVLKDLGLSVAGRVGKPEPEREVTPLDALRNRAAVRLADAKAAHASR